MVMKRLLATFLLLGYVLLVPFCFFGGMVFASAGHMNMSDMQMGAMPDMPATPSGIDFAADHVGMYNSITQTPLTALALLAVSMTVVFLFGFALMVSLLRTSIAETVAYGRTRKREAQYHATIRIRHWLSLFESSPNFA